MMLSREIYSQAVLLANAHKCSYTSIHDIRTTRSSGLQAVHPALLSLASVGCSEPENMYLRSHDIRCIQQYTANYASSCEGA